MWIKLLSESGREIVVNTEKVALIEEHPRKGFVFLVGAGYKEIIQGGVGEVLDALLNAGEEEFLGDEVTKE